MQPLASLGSDEQLSLYHNIESETYGFDYYLERGMPGKVSNRDYTVDMTARRTEGIVSLAARTKIESNSGGLEKRSEGYSLEALQVNLLLPDYSLGAVSARWEGEGKKVTAGVFGCLVDLFAEPDSTAYFRPVTSLSGKTDILNTFIPLLQKGIVSPG